MTDKARVIESNWPGE